MRHGKNPTREQRAVLEREGLDPRAYLYVGEAENGSKIVFRDRRTDEIRVVDKS